jgi:putative heme transporter
MGTRILRIGVIVVFAAAVLSMVVTRRHEVARAASLLRHLHWPWLMAAVTAEAVSFLAFVSVQRSLLRSGGTPVGLGPLTGIALAGNAIDNTVPIGEAWGRVYTFRQFRRRGADPVLAAWTMLAAGFLSGVVLVAITAVGIVLAGGPRATGGLGTAVVGLGAGAAALAVVARRTPLEPLVVAAGGRLVDGWQRLARRRRQDPRAQAEAAWRRLHAVVPGRRAWARAMGLAFASWAADCVCLTAAFAAVRGSPPWPGMVLAYGASQLAACLPILPGGVGLVEGSLAMGLVAYGAQGSVTVAAVVLYRALSFWVLLPIGWAAWAVLARRTAPDPAVQQCAS